MRLELCASTLLLALQLWAGASRDGDGHRRTSPDPLSSPKYRSARSEPFSKEAARLEALWWAYNAAFHAPACAHRDPLAVLDADVDPAPGLEHVIGNRRFGVAMYGSDGMLIARAAPIGCGEAAGGDQSLSLSSHGQRLVLHARDLRADGEHLTAYVVTRAAAELAWLPVDLGGDRGDRQVTGAMYFAGGALEVKYHGRQRAADGGWEAVDDHCTWDLATRSSACRTRAAARR